MDDDIDTKGIKDSADPFDIYITNKQAWSGWGCCLH